MASLHVLPERLLHKRLPRGAQPFRQHHQRSTGLRERSKCVSFEAPKWMCWVLCKEDLPELQKVMLASVMVHVVCVFQSLCLSVNEVVQGALSGQLSLLFWTRRHQSLSALPSSGPLPLRWLRRPGTQDVWYQSE